MTRSNVRYNTIEGLIQDVQLLRREILAGWKPWSSWANAKDRLPSGFSETRYRNDRQIMEWFQNRSISIAKVLTTFDDNNRFWRECLRAPVTSPRIHTTRVVNYNKLREQLRNMEGLDPSTGSYNSPVSFKPTPAQPVKTSQSKDSTAVRELVKEMSQVYHNDFNEAVLEFASPTVISHKLIEYIMAADKTIESQYLQIDTLNEELNRLQDRVTEMEELLTATEAKLEQVPVATVPSTTRLPFGFIRRGNSGVSR